MTEQTEQTQIRQVTAANVIAELHDRGLGWKVTEEVKAAIIEKVDNYDQGDTEWNEAVTELADEFDESSPETPPDSETQEETG